MFYKLASPKYLVGKTEQTVLIQSCLYLWDPVKSQFSLSLFLAAGS